MALLQGRWVPLTWTGDVGVAEEPTEESSRDSDRWMDLADPELREPEPKNIRYQFYFGEDFLREV